MNDDEKHEDETDDRADKKDEHPDLQDPAADPTEHNDGAHLTGDVYRGTYRVT